MRIHSAQEHISEALRCSPVSTSVPTSPTPRQAVIILGMHRSGTSALTGTLSRLGLALPKTPMANADDNPEGFYESRIIFHRNFEILTAEGCFWNVTFPLEPAALQAKAPPALLEELYQILHDEFGDTGSFVLKDPRLCLLLALWLPGIARLAPSQPVLLMVRHPAEVVRSHEVRNERSEHETLLNWLHHMLEAEKVTRSRPRATVLYEDLLSDWRAALGQALPTAGIVTPRNFAEAGPDIDNFLAPSMRHHKVTDAGARIGPDHLKILVDVSWRAFQALARNPLDAFALAALDDARENLHLIRHNMIRQGYAKLA
jgi:hypothetical protein